MLCANFLGSQTQSCLLFGSLPRGQQIPNRLTARLTLKHPDIALFAPHLLMKALESVRRADQDPKRRGKVHPQVREGLVKIGEKVGHRLGLSLLPGLTKHLSLGPYITLGLIELFLNKRDPSSTAQHR